MESKYSKDMARLVGLVGIVAILFSTGVYLLGDKPKVNRNYKEDRRIIDSTFRAKRDSLKNWYEAQIDSLDRVYSAKKDLENLTN